MSALVSRSTRVSNIAGALALVIVVALVAAPWWASIAMLRLTGEIMVYIALASLWNLLAGYTGLVSVGQQAFVGLGAYVLLGLALIAGWNPLWTVPVAGLVAGLIAIPVGRLVFRLQGAYFAIGTWVVAEVFRLIVAQLSILSNNTKLLSLGAWLGVNLKALDALGGGSGTSLPADIMRTVGATKPWREANIYWLALTLGLGALALVYGLLRSRIGLALTAIRDNETASVSLGIKIERVKFAVYVLVATITGMVGTLIELQKVRMSPDAGFSVNDWTAIVIFIVVIGGIGTIEGPIIGTLVYFLLREYLSQYGAYYLMALGALAILIMLVAPQGIWGFVKSRFNLSLFPTAYKVN